MDGYEFVRQLRLCPNGMDTPVIFSSAHYLQAESRRLAEACGVFAVLTKPCDPETVLNTVEHALKGAPSSMPVAAAEHPDEFDRSHLELLTNKLSERTERLRITNLRLARLIEVGQEYILNEDSARIVKEYCISAREIIGATCASIVILNEDSSDIQQFCSSGLDDATEATIRSTMREQGVIEEVITTGEPIRLASQGAPIDLGLPPAHPPVYSFLCAPIISGTRVHGALCLANKLGAEAFSANEEQLVRLLANQLAVTYENARLHSETRARNRELQLELGRRQAAQAETIKACTLALDSMRVKSQFLANVSHELRTPLNGIIGLTELVLDTDLTEEQREYVEMLRKITETFHRQILGLLDFAEIESGKLHLDHSVFDLRSGIASVIDEMAPLARAKSLDIDYRISDRIDSFLVGDLVRLREVMIVLIDNAIKFTQTGSVRVEVDEQSRARDHVLLRFAVSDTGVGIPADRQELIFASFMQVDGSSKRRYGGLGLGLALALELTILMNGRMWVESRGGGGSTFHFTARFALPESSYVARTEDCSRVN